MATLGNVPAEAYTNTVKDSFSGNGSTTAFTMSLPTVTNDVRVVVENVIQDPTVAYSVSGTTLTFTSAPPTGTNNIYVVHLGPAAMTAVPPAEIADATTFASSLTVQGAFTSVGIDDNADAVALTIDSNENVGIGTSSPSAKLHVSDGGGAGLEFIPQTSNDRTTLLSYDRSANTYQTLDTDSLDVHFNISGTEKIRIDSSGNLLVGKTTIATGTAGIALRSNGEVRGTADGDYAARFSRLSSDGAIVGFEKDGAAVGSIGSVSGVDLFVASNRGAGQRYLLDNILPCNSAGAVNNGDIDLGTADYKYRDLFLGGGIHLGGGGSANKLEDYEEGTWTPTVTPSSGSINAFGGLYGTYTKIGREVSLHFQFAVTDIGSGSGNLIVSSLPFAKETSVLTYYGGIFRARSSTSGFAELDGSNLQLYGVTPINSTYLGSIVYTTA